MCYSVQVNFYEETTDDLKKKRRLLGLKYKLHSISVIYMILKCVSISPNTVRFFGSVDAIDELRGQEVAQVLHAVGRGVDIVVATFSVVAEAVSVLHTQVQAGVSGYKHRLADEGSADLKVLQPVVDFVVAFERAGGELPWHNVNFSLPLLNDEGTSQSQTLIWILIFQGLPQCRYQTVASCPLFGAYLDDLPRLPLAGV